LQQKRYRFTFEEFTVFRLYDIEELGPRQVQKYFSSRKY